MAGETPITIVGNIVAEPELRFTPAGAAVCSFRVASTPRAYNKQTQQWEDGEAMFLTCNAWKQLGENAAESLAKGMRVIVTGKLKQRSFQNREGDTRTVFEIDVEEVGPSLRYATTQVNRNPQQGGGQQAPNQQQAQQNAQQGLGAQPAQDPWQSQGGFSGQGSNAEPPF